MKGSSADTAEKTVTFEDRGALDTFIAFSTLTDEQAEELREAVEKEGYGNPVEVPDYVR